MQYIPFALTGIMFMVIFLRMWRTRRRQEPLRNEIAEQEIVYHLDLDHAKVKSFGQPMWTDLKGQTCLIVRTEAFEISAASSSARVAFGMEYYFKARETEIELSARPSLIPRRDWIVVNGKWAGKDVCLAIASRTHLGTAWDALVTAGASPIGPPPVESMETV